MVFLLLPLLFLFLPPLLLPPSPFSPLLPPPFSSYPPCVSSIDIKVCDTDIRCIKNCSSQSMYWQLRLSHCWRRPCEDMTACGPLDCCSSCSSHLSALFAEPGVGRAQAKRPEANSGSGRTCTCVSSLPADAADGLHSALWWLTPRTQP